MEPLERYRFFDFTLSNYSKLLAIAKQNYDFVLYTNESKPTNKSIILRHDLEFSIPIALKMAHIEANQGIQATYFLQIHSDFYNAFDRSNYDAIKEIISLGHKLGLHFDAHFWGITKEEELEPKILLDKETIEKHFDVKIETISFHITNPFLMTCDKETYSGLINVYSKYYKTQVGYCADSTGYWRFEILEDKLLEAKDVYFQLLIHDGMWQESVLPPRRRVFKVIDDQADRLKLLYDDALVKFSAKNIDWDGELHR